MASTVSTVKSGIADNVISTRRLEATNSRLTLVCVQMERQCAWSVSAEASRLLRRRNSLIGFTCDQRAQPLHGRRISQRRNKTVAPLHD